MCYKETPERRERSTPVLELVTPILAGIFIHPCWAQDLTPRAYLITPLHSNAINLTYSVYNGGLEFNGVVPIKGATGTYSVPNVGYYRIELDTAIRVKRGATSKYATRRS